jgi:hypothetical protein
VKQLRAVLQDCLERIDTCVLTGDRLEVVCLQMQYATAGDRARRDVTNFVRGLEDATQELARQDLCAGNPRKSTAAARRILPRVSKRSAIRSGLAAAVLLSVSVSSTWLGSALERRRILREADPFQVGPKLGIVFRNALAERLVKSNGSAFFRGRTYDDTVRGDSSD